MRSSNAHVRGDAEWKAVAPVAVDAIAASADRDDGGEPGGLQQSLHVLLLGMVARRLRLDGAHHRESFAIFQEKHLAIRRRKRSRILALK